MKGTYEPKMLKRHRKIGTVGSTSIAEIAYLGVVSKLRKATISFVMSVRPSVHMKQIGFHWTDFIEA
jgi:hypothetical protein